MTSSARLEEVLAKQKELEAELNSTLHNTAHFSRQLNVLINRVAFSAVSQISNGRTLTSAKVK